MSRRKTSPKFASRRIGKSSATKGYSQSSKRPPARRSIKPPKPNVLHVRSQSDASITRRTKRAVRSAVTKKADKSLRDRIKHPKRNRKPSKRKLTSKRKPSALDRLRSALTPKIASRKRVTVARKRRRSAKKTRRVILKRSRRRAATARRKRPYASFLVFSDGKSIRAKVSRKTARFLGGYLRAVGRFLETNDLQPLELYVGRSFRDASGNVHPLETRPNVLYRLNAAVEPLEEIYRLLA